MIDTGTIIQVAADVVMIIGGMFILIQNFSYWRKYNHRPSLYWVVAGGLAAFLGCWVIGTQFWIPLLFPSLDQQTFAVLGVSRRIIFAVVWLYIVIVAYREYVWKK